LSAEAGGKIVRHDRFVDFITPPAPRPLRLAAGECRGPHQGWPQGPDAVAEGDRALTGCRHSPRRRSL